MSKFKVGEKIKLSFEVEVVEFDEKYREYRVRPVGIEEGSYWLKEKELHNFKFNEVVDRLLKED